MSLFKPPMAPWCKFSPTAQKRAYHHLFYSNAMGSTTGTLRRRLKYFILRLGEVSWKNFIMCVK